LCEVNQRPRGRVGDASGPRGPRPRRSIKKIMTIVDRLEGATENLRKEGIELALYTTRALG
jgi:hypothetical protein